MSRGRTRKDLERIVDHLNKVNGRPTVAYSMTPAGQRKANEGHLFVDTWSPGDGKTRYRLARLAERGGVSFIGTNRNFTLREFDAFLTGILAAREVARTYAGREVNDA